METPNKNDCSLKATGVTMSKESSSIFENEGLVEPYELISDPASTAWGFSKLNICLVLRSVLKYQP